MLTPAERSAAISGISALGLVLVSVGLFLNFGSYDVTIGLITAIVIVVVSIPIFRRLADHDEERKLLSVLTVALTTKLVFSLARYWMVNKLYGGGGDSNRYVADGWVSRPKSVLDTRFPVLSQSIRPWMAPGLLSS